MVEEHPHRPDEPKQPDRIVAGQGQEHQSQSYEQQRSYETQRGYDNPRTYESSRTDRPAAELRGPGWLTARRIAWGAVFAGVVIVLAVQLLLNMLGIGIGAAIIDPSQGADPAAWSIGAAIWWVVVGLIALFLGGWVAGHLATNPDRRDGALHGLVTWGLATLLGVWLLTGTLGTLATGAWEVASTGVQTAAETTDQQPMAQIDPQDEQQFQQQAERTLEDIQEGAPQVADTAADVTAQVGIWSFIALALGAVAAGFGGYLATPSNAPGVISERSLSDRDDRNRR